MTKTLKQHLNEDAIQVRLYTNQLTEVITPKLAIAEVTEWLMQKRQEWENYGSTTGFIEGYKACYDELLEELNNDQ